MLHVVEQLTLNNSVKDVQERVLVALLFEECGLSLDAQGLVPALGEQQRLGQQSRMQAALHGSLEVAHDDGLADHRLRFFTRHSARNYFRSARSDRRRQGSQIYSLPGRRCSRKISEHILRRGAISSVRLGSKIYKMKTINSNIQFIYSVIRFLGSNGLDVFLCGGGNRSTVEAKMR